MNVIKTSIGRRSFIKTSALAGGGLMISFNWMVSCKPGTSEVLEMPDEWFEINGFLKIGNNGVVSIMSPNPEIGQNVKTSMPMIVAEELDVDWNKVLVEQAPLNTTIFTRQLAGGSQSISQSWNGLRMAGASGRHMLKLAAAKTWQVPVEEITTDNGVLSHQPSGKTAGYGEMASAAVGIPVPEEISLKNVGDFKIISTSKRNVDGAKIVTGKPLFGLDYKAEGMKIAMIAHPPAFGLKLKSVDASEAERMPGIHKVLTVSSYGDDYIKDWCDTSAFTDLVVVVGNSTWEVMNAKKALKLEWEPITRLKEKVKMWGGRVAENEIPGGLENTTDHQAKNG